MADKCEVAVASDNSKAVKSISRDDDQSGQSGWMFARMQTQIPRISFASRHVVDGAGRRDLRSAASLLPLATWRCKDPLSGCRRTTAKQSHLRFNISLDGWVR
jgi:hypothetical protein